MPKILITGNGFDLFHGLPTKYGHFMAVMKTIEKYDFKPEVTFEDLFGDTFKNEFTEDYKLIQNNYKTENILFDRTKIKELEEKLRTNNWYNYFKTVLEIETWIDFENEINIALSEVLEILNHDTISKQDAFVECQKHSLLSFFNLFDKTQPTGLRLNKKYTKEKKVRTGLYKNPEINDKKIFEDLSVSLNDFKIIFNRYFVDIVDKFYPNIKIDFLFPLRNIKEIYTFNYTPTIEKIYNIDVSRVTYLHGKINPNDDDQNLILGVDDIPETLKKIKLYNFTKYYQKIKNRANLKFIDVPKRRSNAMTKTTFYIIGHSLDESDKIYLIDLFNYLEMDMNMKTKVCVFYYNDNDFENKLRNIYSIIDKDILAEKNKKGLFYFLELTPENIDLELNEKDDDFSNVFEPQVF